MSAPILQISLSQAPVFVLNSRLGLSCATGLRSGSKFLHALRLSLSLSYGYNLPSSLTRVVPRTLGFSPRLPVSVSVRALHLSLEAFLDSMAHLNLTLPKYRLSISSRSYDTDFPISQPTTFDTLFQSRAQATFCVTPSFKQSEAVQEY